MWFVEEGARVEEWDKLCEMQSDKAAVEISINYAGMIKKLYAQADDMVKTGAPLVDIDDGLPGQEAENEEEEPAAELMEEGHEDPNTLSARDEEQQIATEEAAAAEAESQAAATKSIDMIEPEVEKEEPRKGPFLATPAVRGLLKEHEIDIAKVKGSGKHGRVLKEDVQGFLEIRDNAPAPQMLASPAASLESIQTETAHPLSAIQSQMYRAMTASLAIPHFLYADEVNITNITNLRRRLNDSRGHSDPKLTLLPFILKAMSISLDQYPVLNARIDTTTNSSKPQLMHRGNHNIGIAMDSPVGLLVPVVKNVAALSILEIAREINRLSELGQAKKLSSAHLGGGSITVSNVGNIGGTVVSPVIVEGQVAILGVGKSRTVPVFGENGSLERAEIVNFSWSADHRVIDGATMARMGSMVKKLMEEPERMMVTMR